MIKELTTFVQAGIDGFPEVYSIIVLNDLRMKVVYNDTRLDEHDAIYNTEYLHFPDLLFDPDFTKSVWGEGPVCGCCNILNPLSGDPNEDGDYWCRGCKDYTKPILTHDYHAERAFKISRADGQDKSIEYVYGTIGGSDE
jgi:hypothetical protein